MAAEDVIFLAILKSDHDGIIFCRALRAVMSQNVFREGPGLPAFHPCREHSNQIDSAAADGRVASDRFEAFSPEQLARAGNVLDADKAVIVANIVFLEGSSHQS